MIPPHRQRQGRARPSSSLRRPLGTILRNSNRTGATVLVSTAARAEARGSLGVLLEFLTMVPICLALPVAQGASPATQPTATQAAGQALPSSVPAEPTPEEVVLGEIGNVYGENSPEIRRAAAAKILQAGSAEGIKALVAVFASANNEAAKLAVCEAIAEANSQAPEFIAPLQALLGHKRVDLGQAAAGALAGYSDPDVAVNLAAYRQAREQALMKESLDRLMETVYELTIGEEQRVALLQQWLKSGLSLERLKALKIIDEPLRAKGIKPANGVLTQVREIAADPDPAVRQYVVIVLRDLGLLEDVPRVRAMLKREKSAPVREEIYKMLSKLTAPDSVDDCIAGLEDPVEQVAAAAADALGRLCEKGNGQPAEKLAGGVEALIRRMERPIATSQLRGDLIEAMADIADPKFAPFLVKHARADEKEPAIRQAALRGIGRIGQPEHLEIVLERLSSDTHVGVREAAAEAVGQLGHRPEHLQALRGRLDPKAKETAGAQNRAWQAYKLVFQRLEDSEQQAALASLTGNDAKELGRKIELLSELETRISAHSPSEQQLADIRAQLGNTLLASGQPEEAAAAWLRALVVIAAGRPADRARLTAKVAGVVDSFLKASAPDKALALAAKVKSPEVRAAVADRFVQHLEELSRSDRKAAVDVLDKLTKSVPDRFGPPWDGKFATLRKGLEQTPSPATQPGATQPAATQPVTTQPTS